MKYFGNLYFGKKKEFRILKTKNFLKNQNFDNNFEKKDLRIFKLKNFLRKTKLITLYEKLEF